MKKFDGFDKGQEAYETLIECVDTSINQENGEIAFICANGLKSMTEVEQGNYFGGNLVEFPRMRGGPLRRRELWNIANDRMQDTVDYIEHHGGTYPPWADKEYEEFKDYVEKR